VASPFLPRLNMFCPLRALHRSRVSPDTCMSLTTVARIFEYRQLRQTEELRACNLYSGVRESLPGVLQVDSFIPYHRRSAP
jgi:hypothetical protein